jgi:hypothetical protein
VSDSRLSLVLACGERGVSHLVEPGTPAGELTGIVALYFAPAELGPGPLRARVAGVEFELDPRLPIGDQVAPDAEILFPAP